MKKCVALASLVLIVGVATAQERVPDDKARQIAKLLTEHAAKAKPPFKTTVDEEKPFAYTHMELGAMVLPVKGLTANTLAKAGKDITPIGQFWMKGLAPQVEGKLVSADQLNQLTISHDGQDVTVTLYILGVRKGAKGLEMALCTKNKKPLLVAPIEQVEVKQELPLEFEPKKGEQSADLIFTCEGKYRFKFTIAKQE